ncbi:hypothetical protein NKI20_22270, partial [Mesorhizobium sp. M0830]
TFLTAPRQMVPGTQMTVGVSNAAQRAAIALANVAFEGIRVPGPLVGLSVHQRMTAYWFFTR